jgi:hypothetical protein
LSGSVQHWEVDVYEEHGQPGEGQHKPLGKSVFLAKKVVCNHYAAANLQRLKAQTID